MGNRIFRELELLCKVCWISEQREIWLLRAKSFDYSKLLRDLNLILKLATEPLLFALSRQGINWGIYLLLLTF